MQIGDHKVVSIHYTLRDKDGQVIDSSEGSSPLAYIHGKGNIIPGLEDGLLGKAVGDKLTVVVAPEHGYGVHNENLVQVLPRDMFQGIDDIQPGMQFQAVGGNGPVVITVKGVDGDRVTVDGNHELAGVELHFDVEIVDVRDATAEELLHGHSHGAGGCCGGGGHDHDHGHDHDEDEQGGSCCGGGCH